MSDEDVQHDHNLVPPLAGLVAGIAIGSGLAALAWRTGHDDTARGIVVGVGLTVIGVAVLWMLGKKAGMPGRVAAARADERDNSILTTALAHMGIATMIAACGGLVAGLYDVDGITIAGIVMWAGLLTLVVSVIVQSRRR